jgi:hypothetical protein
LIPLVVAPVTLDSLAMTPSGTRFAISTCAILAHLATTTILPASADQGFARDPVSNRTPARSLAPPSAAAFMLQASMGRAPGIAALDRWNAAEADRTEPSPDTGSQDAVLHPVQPSSAPPTIARSSAGRSLWWIWTSSAVVAGLAIAAFAHDSPDHAPPDRPPLPDFPGTP